jgi:ribosomal protein S17E
MSSDLGELKRRVEALRSRVSYEEGQKSAVEGMLKDATEKAEAAELTAKTFDEASALLSKYADSRQEKVRNLVEGLITKGLTEVFEEPLHFHVRTKDVGRRTDTYFTLSSMMGDEEIETDILSARGGGVAAVTGFLLRVVFILLHKAPRVLFLDESFAQVSENYEPRLAEFIDSLCTEYGVRIVLVTHSQNPVWQDYADSVYTSKMVNGETKLETTK